MAMNGSYILRESTSNLTRNITLTIASVLTVFVSLAILGTTVIVRQGASNMTEQWKGGIEFMVYVKADATPAQIKALRTNLEDNPLIKRVVYVDREQTYKDFREMFKDDPVMLESAKASDLPTRFKVEPYDKSAETVRDLVNLYQKQPVVYDVRAALGVIKQFKGMTDFLNRGLSVFAGFLLVAGSLLILNTIRTAMFARRREIEVMKLVGATNWFIRIPFMIEGLVQGLIGGVLAIGSVFVSRGFLEDMVNKSEDIGLLQDFKVTSGDVVLACVIVAITAILLSIISSIVATRRFLDV
ncbi:MAG: ABC transporter permease [Acidimicrobiales bacterium]|nr:ABC transporter permease [Acidimicrobiales bacterium]